MKLHQAGAGYSWLAQSRERLLSNPAIQGRLSSKSASRWVVFCAHDNKTLNFGFLEISFAAKKKSTRTFTGQQISTLTIA